MTWSRASGISSPHRAQVPYTPAPSRAIAASIALSRSCARSNSAACVSTSDKRSRHVHLVSRRLPAVASLLAHQFFHPGERFGALFGEQALERIDPASAGVNCGFHPGLLPLTFLRYGFRRSSFCSSFHICPAVQLRSFNISIDRASRHFTEKRADSILFPRTIRVQ